MTARALWPSTPAPDLPWEVVDVDAPAVPFDSMGFDSRLESGFHSLGFEGTRPVQGAVIPVALEGHDVVAKIGKTRTGAMDRPAKDIKINSVKIEKS